MHVVKVTGKLQFFLNTLGEGSEFALKVALKDARNARKYDKSNRIYDDLIIHGHFPCVDLRCRNQ